MLKLTWNLGVWKLDGDKKVQRALVKAAKASGNRAITAMRAASKKEMRARSTIAAKYLADRSFPLSKPTGNTLEALVWTMRVSGAGVPLGEFKRSQVKAGVKVQILKGGPAKLITHAFLAKTLRERAGVFLRPSKARYPMGHKLGPRVSDMMNDETVIEAVQGKTLNAFRGAFAYLIKQELAKVK